MAENKNEIKCEESLPLNDRQICEVAIRKNLNIDRFLQFMRRAFKSVDLSEAYVEEWAVRFQSGFPMKFMDRARKRLYMEISE